MTSRRTKAPGQLFPPPFSTGFSTVENPHQTPASIGDLSYQTGLVFDSLRYLKANGMKSQAQQSEQNMKTNVPIRTVGDKLCPPTDTFCRPIQGGMKAKKPEDRRRKAEGKGRRPSPEVRSRKSESRSQKVEGGRRGRLLIRGPQLKPLRAPYGCHGVTPWGQGLTPIKDRGDCLGLAACSRRPNTECANDR